MSDPNMKWTLDHIDYSDAPTLWLAILRDHESDIRQQVTFAGDDPEQLCREYVVWKNGEGQP